MNPPRRSADVTEYNAVATKVMTESAVAINDLNSVVISRLPELQLPANVHFKEPGYDALARQVAKTIQMALTSPRVSFRPDE